MKHAVVIGGTRGIGAGVTKVLDGLGWTVTATGVSSEEVDAFSADRAVMMNGPPSFKICG